MHVAQIRRMTKRNLDKRLPLTHSVKMATLLDLSTRALLQLSDDVMEDMLYAAKQLMPVLSPRSLTAVTAVAALHTVQQLQHRHISDSLSKKMKLIQKHTISSQSHPDLRLRDQIKA